MRALLLLLPPPPLTLFSAQVQIASSEVNILKDKVSTLGRQLLASSSSTSSEASARAAQLVDLSTLSAESSSLEATKKVRVSPPAPARSRSRS